MNIRGHVLCIYCKPFCFISRIKLHLLVYMIVHVHVHVHVPLLQIRRIIGIINWYRNGNQAQETRDPYSRYRAGRTKGIEKDIYCNIQSIQEILLLLMKRLIGKIAKINLIQKFLRVYYH